MPNLLTLVPAAPLLLTLAAGATAAQPPTPRDTEHGAFVVLAGADTFAVERFTRAAASVQGSIALRTPAVRLGYTLTPLPDARVASLRLEQRASSAPEGAPAASVMDFTFAGDTVVALVGGQTQRMAVRAGALPWLNPSMQLAEQLVRRAASLGGTRVTVPVVDVAGGQQFDATVTRTADSVVVAFPDAEMRFAVDAAGRITGGRIPAQNIRIVRLDSAAARALSMVGASGAGAGTAPDAPYVSEDVTVRTTGGHTLAGTLTRPRGVARAPAVVLVSGSGPQDRDGAMPLIPGYRPFRQIADTLGRRGIAVLRLDDRGVGGSGGASASVTSADFADDARAALAYLRARPDIDPARLALAGHSEGGMVAPMVAVTDPALRALVLLAGPGRTGREISIMQQRQAFERYMPDSTPQAREAAFTRNLAVADSMAERVPWLRFWFTHDPIATARRVRQPVLVLQGETDTQVPPEHATLLADAIRAGGNTRVTVRLFPALNHLFLPDTDGDAGVQGSRYATLPIKELPPAVLGALADWLVVQLR